MSNDRGRRVSERRGTRVDEGDEPRWRRGLFRGAIHDDDWLGRNRPSRLLHRVGEIVADAGAGIIAALVVLGWAVVGVVAGFPRWWETVLYAVTASVTFVMVFVIQHTQSRQITAVQRKLDELLRATPGDNRLIAVEEAPDEELQALADRNLADRNAAVDDDDEEGKT
jgi:low affinity Fe/Cu permease